MSRLNTPGLLALLMATSLLGFACSDSGSKSTPDGSLDADGADGSGGDELTDGGSDGTDVDDPDPQLATIDDLSYLGAFRLSSADFGESNTNYAVGTLGYNPQNHSLYIAGHAHHNAVAEFGIPEPGLSDQVDQLPVVDKAVQDFATVLGASPNGNPENIDRITGMLWVDGQLLINAETWYDAPGANVDTTLVVRDGDDLAGDVDGYFELDGAARAAGYMSPIPGNWQEKLGGAYLSGWSSVYSIIGRYSVGPSLFVFDPQDMLDTSTGAQGPVNTTAFMDYPHSQGEYLAKDALLAEEGSASALWNFLSRGIYGFIIPGTRTFAVFGSSGGVDSGIGYKITQDDGNLCGGYCSYAAADNYNYYWFFDLDEVLAAAEVYQPQPYAYGRWSVPFDDNGAHEIMGGAFNPTDNVLYLALENAGQVGEYDRPPLIVVFSLGQ